MKYSLSMNSEMRTSYPHGHEVNSVQFKIYRQLSTIRDAWKRLVGIMAQTLWL